MRDKALHLHCPSGMVIATVLAMHRGLVHHHIPFDPAFGVRFSVSVDTEEEFDWAGILSRDGHGLASAHALAEGQKFFNAAGVVPIYYADGPIVGCDIATDVLASAAADHAADIGVHLHPWVTPPFTEDVNRYNSYVGNLDSETERAKIRWMRDYIVQRIGVTPLAYRAGRYGIGPNSVPILIDEGFRVDSSHRPLFDYSDDGGPDFRHTDPRPSWADANKKLIELPLSAHYLGWGGRLKPLLFDHIRDSALARAVAARMRLVERVPLTPEGTPAHLACAMIDHALRRGMRLLLISFHSPSLAPGHTPYVRDKADLNRFYGWFDAVFNHCAKRGVQPSTLAQIVAAADRVRQTS